MTDDQLAVLGGSQAVVEPFPGWPQADQLESRLLQEALDSGQWWQQGGNQVRRFEREFAARHGVAHGLGVTNGTHALELALRTLGIGAGDEVIVPSLTFVSTAMAVLLVGARPIPIDVAPDSWCLDPHCLAAAVGSRTRAVIPVHFAGQIAEMDQVLDVCRRRNVAVIEDAAHAHGAKWCGRSAGSFGVMAAFSFQNFKLLTAGEGGALLFNDEELYRRATVIANCGREPGDTAYRHYLLGSNFRMTEFQGAVLNAQLSRLDGLAERRAARASELDHLLEGVAGITPQSRDPRTERHAFYMYVFRYDPYEFSGVSRAAFVRALAAEGVPAYRMYPRVQDAPYFVAACGARAAVVGSEDPCPVAGDLAEAGVWLHHRVLLGTPASVRQVVTAIEKIRRHAHHLVQPVLASA